MLVRKNIRYMRISIYKRRSLLRVLVGVFFLTLLGGDALGVNKNTPPFSFPFAQMSQSDLGGGSMSELDSTNQLQLIREKSVLKAISELRYNDALSYLFTCLAISGDERDTLGIQMAYAYLSVLSQVSGNTDESLRFARHCDSLNVGCKNSDYRVAFKAILGSALFFSGDTAEAFQQLYPIAEVTPNSAELS